jgi:hypothetical protein
MRSTVAKAAQSTPFHSLEPRMAKASIPVNRSETSEDSAPDGAAVSLVLETLGAIGMSDKEACLCMEFDASTFSKVKAGTKRLPFDALWKLPDSFWAEFHDRIARAKQLTPETKRQTNAALIGELVRRLVEGSTT